MTAARGDGQTSAACVTDDWYIVCRESELTRRPLSRTLLGMPLVLFRDGRGTPAALVDRCPHRNAPLSMGRVHGEHLQCGYHGWEFDRDGTVQNIPGLCRSLTSRGRGVDAFPCRELDGFVWVYATPNVTPAREPYRFPYVHDSRYTTVRETRDLEATVHAVAENALDVPHTAFLHQGMFRGSRKSREIEVVVRRWADRVEAEYVGEPRPAGIAGKVLAPGGGTVTHFDRFILPSIAQVEYRLGRHSHLCISNALTPLDDFYTRMFAVVTFRLPVPGAMVVQAVRPVIHRILAQDATVLRKQTETIRRFGGEHFSSTELDVLGAHIARLLRDAERGGRTEPTPDAEPATKTVRMRI